MLFYDWTYLILIPGLILALIAQWRVQAAYQQYSRVASRSGLTGAELAARFLHGEGIDDVAIERVAGRMTDHYDPAHKALRLSEGVADSTSLAALGVAAHEAGHALQHRDAYAPLVVRTAAIPMANIGSNLAWPLFLLGLIFSWQPLQSAGILLFSLAVLVTLITLPVEFNASRRAIAALESGAYLAQDELSGARSVLSAAALTYVAAALMAILQLMRLLALSGRSRSRR